MIQIEKSLPELLKQANVSINSTQPANREVAEIATGRLYNSMQYKAPKQYLWVDSPLMLFKLIEERLESWQFPIVNKLDDLERSFKRNLTETFKDGEDEFVKSFFRQLDERSLHDHIRSTMYERMRKLIDSNREKYKNVLVYYYTSSYVFAPFALQNLMYLKAFGPYVSGYSSLMQPRIEVMENCFGMFPFASEAILVERPIEIVKDKKIVFGDGYREISGK